MGKREQGRDDEMKHDKGKKIEKKLERKYIR